MIVCRGDESNLPSLASNKVTNVGPLNIVFSSGAVVVSNLTLTVGPERVEEAIVHASASGGGACSQVGRLFLSLSLSRCRVEDAHEYQRTDQHQGSPVNNGYASA